MKLASRTNVGAVADVFDTDVMTNASCLGLSNLERCFFFFFSTLTGIFSGYEYLKQ